MLDAFHGSRWQQMAADGRQTHAVLDNLGTFTPPTNRRTLYFLQTQDASNETPGGRLTCGDRHTGRRTRTQDALHDATAQRTRAAGAAKEAQTKEGFRMAWRKRFRQAQTLKSFRNPRTWRRKHAFSRRESAWRLN